MVRSADFTVTFNAAERECAGQAGSEGRVAHLSWLSQQDVKFTPYPRYELLKMFCGT